MVSIRELHFSYRKKPVFTGLNLELQGGQIYGLLGKNGTGKSTLLRNIAGTLFPKKGRIEAMGYEPGKRLPAFLQRVFLIPEEFNLPAISLGDWVKYNSVFYPGFSGELFNGFIGDFQVPMDNKLSEMSHGQQKKALISFALATGASLLLMDEPTNGLDIHSKSQFRKVMAGVLEEGKCVVISTHQVKDLENLIDRVAVIDDGKILFDQALAAIARAFTFTISFDPEEAAGAIYSEPSLKGNALLLPNSGQEEGQVDLEILYKAIVQDPLKINHYFPIKK